LQGNEKAPTFAPAFHKNSSPGEGDAGGVTEKASRGADFFSPVVSVQIALWNSEIQVVQEQEILGKNRTVKK